MRRRAVLLVCPLLLVPAGCSVAGSTRALAYYAKAHRYYRAGDYDRAIAYYDTTLTLFHRILATGVYADRGLAYAANGMPERAVVDYDSALAILDSFYMAYYLRGRAHLQMNEPLWAVDDFDAALRIEPTHTASRYRRAQAWHRADSAERALGRVGPVP